MSRIVRCPYCNNEFYFKHAGKLFKISEGDRRYIVIRCLNCKGLLKYRRSVVIKV
jgi:predicted nucleic-acid-binding Zn-ribbon protein